VKKMKKVFSFIVLAGFISIVIGAGAAQAQSKNCDALIKEAQAQLASAKGNQKGQVQKLLAAAQKAKAKGDQAACQASATKAMQATKPGKK
jgi:hypothetical protein